MMTMGQRIAERRKALGLSQDDLSKLMGYKTRSSISRIESDENDIPQKKIKKFASVLHCSEAYILCLTNEVNYPEDASDPDVEALYTDTYKKRQTIVDGELLDAFHKLSDDGKNQAISFVKYLVSQEEKK